MLNHVIQRPYLIGVTLAVVFPITLIVPLFIFLGLRKASSFPFISDLGIYYPEAAIFILGFYVSSLLALMTTVLQYWSVKLSLKPENVVDQRLNLTSLVFGIIAIPCFVGIAVFPVDKLVEAHYLAFSTTWFTVNAFQLLQSILTYRTNPGSSMAKGRLAISILCIIFAFAFYLTVSMIYNSWPQRNLVNSIIAGCQWFVSLLMFATYLTYMQEMKNSRITLGFEVVEPPPAQEVKKTNSVA